jgi:hypothetical protein
MRSTLITRREGNFAVDTTFVLFFLAVDIGRSSFSLSFETALSLLTLGMLMVLPYFLPSESERPDFVKWLIGRSVIMVFAVSLGILFSQALGVVLPDMFRLLPMTLLILTASVSCYLQFYAMIRFRLAR